MTQAEQAVVVQGEYNFDFCDRMSDFLFISPRSKKRELDEFCTVRTMCVSSTHPQRRPASFQNKNAVWTNAHHFVPM